MNIQHQVCISPFFTNNVTCDVHFITVIYGALRHMRLKIKKTDYSQIIHANEDHLIHLHRIIDIYDTKKCYIAN